MSKVSIHNSCKSVNFYPKFYISSYKTSCRCTFEIIRSLDSGKTVLFAGEISKSHSALVQLFQNSAELFCSICTDLVLYCFVCSTNYLSGFSRNCRQYNIIPDRQSEIKRKWFSQSDTTVCLLHKSSLQFHQPEPSPSGSFHTLRFFSSLVPTETKASSNSMSPMPTGRCAPNLAQGVHLANIITVIILAMG